jgi:hypothetical protein
LNQTSPELSIAAPIGVLSEEPDKNPQTPVPEGDKGVRLVPLLLGASSEIPVPLAPEFTTHRFPIPSIAIPCGPYNPPIVLPFVPIG